MNFIRRGEGKPLLLVHGLGGSWRSWGTVLDDLARDHKVIAPDLPGFGETPPLAGEVTIETLAEAVTDFLAEHERSGIATVGSSMGGRLVLELARRSVVGATVSLDPGGFWSGWQAPYFEHSIGTAIRLVRALQPQMPKITASAAGRAMLFAQFSAHPARIPPDLALAEMRGYAASPSFDPLLNSLVHGPEQKGAAGDDTAPILIGWGRKDRVCPPGQSEAALAKFPGAKLYWFEDCGHFPQWDKPHETCRVIRDHCG
jgi:pimeloyl-ACP methyl ester carboxylesterase